MQGIKIEWLEVEKEKTAERINEILVSNLDKHIRTCRKCRGILDWNSSYGLCQSCYEKIQTDRWYYDY